MQKDTAEKLNRIQSLFDAGKTHAEIAKELGYKKIESFYRYIYRYDDSLNYKKAFNKKTATVIQGIETEQEKPEEKTVETKNATASTSKAETVIMLIGKGLDIREVAKKLRYKDAQDLADYMSSKGYAWDGSVNNYVLKPKEKKATPKVIEAKEQEKLSDTDIRDIMNGENEGSYDFLDRYGDILKLLRDNKDRLVELLSGQQESQGNLPRYILPGTTVGKTFNMVQPLKELIIEFSEEYNVQQKDIFAIAMIDFFKKYGYREEVRVRLKV